MLCLKNCHKIGFSILLSVFFSVLLFSPSYAISDVTQTFNSATYDTDVFTNCTGSCLTQYSYLIVSSPSHNFVSSSRFLLSIPRYHDSQSPVSISFSGVTSGSGVDYSFTNYYTFPLTPDYQYPYLKWANNYTFTSPLTLTLTENPFSPPTGNLDISQNGEYDVSNFATVNVNVPDTIVEGDYHNDLVTINNSIIKCGAILLVLYFFYSIYRMIIKTTGGQ